MFSNSPCPLKTFHPATIIRSLVCVCLLSFGLPTAAIAKQDPMLLTARYMTTIHQKLQKNWRSKKIPLMEIHLRSATVTLWLKKNGTLLKAKISNPSGNKAYDKALLASVKRSSPYPALPAHLHTQARKTGLDIVFRPRVFRKKLLPLKRKYKGSATIPNWVPKKSKNKKKNKK